MSATVVNLRRARKARARRQAEADAAANRVLHGTPPRLHDLADAEERRRNAELDAHRREPPPDGA